MRGLKARLMLHAVTTTKLVTMWLDGRNVIIISRCSIQPDKSTPVVRHWANKLDTNDRIYRI